MPSSDLLQLMGIPVPISPPPAITTTNNNGDGDDDEGEMDEDTISILPSQSYDNFIIDLSKASFHEIESRLSNIGATGGGTIVTDAANINFDEEQEEEGQEGIALTPDALAENQKVSGNGNAETLDERDLNPLLEMLLRGKNDDIDEETMHRSMSIYRKILRSSCHESCAATAGASIGGMTNATGLVTTATGLGDGLGGGVGAGGKIVVHEEMLVYAVRKKYSDEFMEELMNMLLDAVEESNYAHHNNKENIVDGRRILELALIYGNVGASRAIVQRYPQSLQMSDNLRGQIPLHIACHVGMMVEDDDNDDDGADCDDGISIATGATGRSSIIRRKRRKQRQAELIELLVTEGIKYNVGGFCGAGGLYQQDNYGTTPLMQLIHALNNPFTWDDVNHDNHHDHHGLQNDNNTDKDHSDKSIIKPKTKRRPSANLEICIKAAWNSRGPNNQFPILHEAMNISSPDAFYRIIDIVKYYDNNLSGTDQRGRTALVKAIYIDQIIQRRTSKRDIIRMILGGVTSECATLRDGAGRLPLHIAVEMGLRWNDGLRDIINAFDGALEEPHSVMGFYPFILYAQAGPGNKDLDTLYNLVREQPKLITKAKKNRRKSVQVNNIGNNNKYRPLTPSVHRPLVHQSPRNRYNSLESDSEQTIPTLHSSSSTTIGDNDDTMQQKNGHAMFG